MKNWLALLLLCLGLLAPAQAQVVGPYLQAACNQSLVVNAGGTGLAKILSGSAGKVIYICGWHVTNTAASGTFQLSSGTGSNCGTGTTNITPALSVSNTAPATDHMQYAFAQVAATAPLTGNQSDLCFNPSVNTIAAIVYVGQF